MALVTVQRSPSPTNFPDSDDGAVINVDNKVEVSSDGQADSIKSTKSSKRQKSSTSERYFAVKGAAVILPQNECIMMPKQSSTAGGEIQLHLQAMLHLLRAQDTLKMAVRLESAFSQHCRYMAIVSTMGRQDNHESVLLGLDYVAPDLTSIGLVVPIWADTCITLDGDGGILIESGGAQHLFKPVSVQAMWSAFQSLHKEHNSACSPYPYFPGGLTHTWTQYYETRTTSKEAFRSEWHYVYCKDECEELRADSMQRFKEKPPEKAAREKLMRTTLKDIMQSVDLDEVTSKDIRQTLEERLGIKLHHCKEFIDQEMLVILGQMDRPSKIFDHLYLGSEWNASNWDELRQNNVGYILNVTKEVDNFFPGMFHYMKIRVSDEESTELLKHWDLTFKFISKAKENNAAVLVHCKKGISRSSSTVVAYAMKSYGWSLEKALNYVKDKRNCITPNRGFLEQLTTYQGILEASQHRRSQLFNKIKKNPQSPDLIPWDGLFEEFDEESSFNKCSVSHPDPGGAPGSQSLCPGDLSDSPKHTLLIASDNILKSGPSDDSTMVGPTVDFLSKVDRAPVRSCTLAPRTNFPRFAGHSSTSNHGGTKMVRSLVNIFEQCHQKPSGKQNCQNGRKFVKFEPRFQLPIRNRQVNFRRVESAGIFLAQTCKNDTNLGNLCKNRANYVKSASIVSRCVNGHS